MWIYVLHFSRPIGHAQHYLGSTDDLERRLEQHAAGTGAKLIAELVRRGDTFEVAALFRSPDRTPEVQRKRNNAIVRRLCPICTPKPDWHNRAEPADTIAAIGIDGRWPRPKE